MNTLRRSSQAGKQIVDTHTAEDIDTILRKILMLEQPVSKPAPDDPRYRSLQDEAVQPKLREQCPVSWMITKVSKAEQ